MAIATDIEVNWRGTVDNTNKIGLSSTLNLLGTSVFENADYCLGFQNPALKLTKESDGYPKSTGVSNNVAFYITNNVGYSLNGVNNPNGAYYRTLLVAVPTNWTWGWDSNLRSNNNTVRIVTKLDLSKNKGYLTTLETTKGDRVTTNNLVYGVNESLPNTGALGILLVGNTEYKILCANVYATDNGYYIKFPEYIDSLYDNFNAQYGEGALPNFNYDINSNMMFSASPAMFNNAGWTISTSASGPSIYNVSTYSNTEIEVPPDTNNPDYKIFGTYSRVGNFYWRVQFQMSVEYWLLLISSFGLFFEWNGVSYKPIIENGVLKGYTNDMAVKSDIDNWTNVTGHNISPTPPTGGITDKETNMPLAYIGGTAGMVSFIQINKSGLASADDISEAISRFDIATIGKDLLRNFISFKAFAAITLDDTVDRQIKIAGIPLEDSGGNALTGRYIGGVKPIDLFPVSGGVTIPTLYNDYRDYEPYTKIQMYVPFCGWFSLPSWCIGKKITGTMFTDLYNGTVKAVIYASQTVVAEVGGCCAYDIPFVADATGTKAGAVISSALTTAAAVGATVAMPNVATGIAAVSSAANLAATLNGNDTTLKGVLGDGSNLNGLLHVYIKVSRPKSPNGSTAIPDSYKHEIGIPTMKEITISAGDGYVQVTDAKVTGTMTAREKQMIVDGFRHGLNF